MFERFITRHAILKDNLTLLGYDLVFRSQQPGTGAQSTPPAAYTIDAATMVFPWESLIGNNLAFVAFEAQELLGGAALLLPRGRSVIDIHRRV